jgi:hypothetical protein
LRSNNSGTILTAEDLEMKKRLEELQSMINEHEKKHQAILAEKSRRLNETRERMRKQEELMIQKLAVIIIYI